jgi:heme-degrading monooxygenase HmoA
MITEIAQIDIKPGSEKDFEAAIAKAQAIFKRCKGWKGLNCTARSRSRHATGC